MRRDGSLKLQGRQPHLSEALAGEAAGLVEVEEELDQFWFCDYRWPCWTPLRAPLGRRLRRPPSSVHPSRLGG